MCRQKPPNGLEGHEKCLIEHSALLLQFKELSVEVKV